MDGVSWFAKFAKFVLVPPPRGRPNTNSGKVYHMEVVQFLCGVVWLHVSWVTCAR